MCDKGENVMSTEILENLKNAVAEYDAEGARDWTKKAIEAGIDPVDAADAITEVLKQIGDGFGRGELFLPELVGGAEAMKGAMAIIQEEMKRRGGKKLKAVGTVAIGTVYGDIHDIGKALVSTLLTAGGFQVIDLGINVSAEAFVQAVREDEPEILAMSALMTTTVSEQEKVIRSLEREGLRHRVRVMVGGGGITKEFAVRIGADGYGSTAPEAVKLANGLLSVE
jgi:corrinoid protein of di/trimethylamine methyltransferase